MRMYYRVDIRDEEIEDSKIDLISWAFKHMVEEFDRTAPHGPINMRRYHESKTKIHRLQIDAEFKEPIQ